MELRRTLLLPLDDLLGVTRNFICAQATRSGLDRSLRRHGVGNLNALKLATPHKVHKSFDSYEPGYLHMDVKYLPQMADETQRHYLFVAIDRATRWVLVAIKKNGVCEGLPQCPAQGVSAEDPETLLTDMARSSRTGSLPPVRANPRAREGLHNLGASA